MVARLMPDMPVPPLNLPLAGGGGFDLAAEAPENFTMLVFYRGYHCPVCETYIGRLETLAGKYRDAGFSLVAVSMDGQDRAEKARVEWRLEDTPVAYDLSAQKAREWGLYLSEGINGNETPVFSEPGLFWVRPDRRLYLADVSNMPWARPDLEFLLSKARFAVANDYPARGMQG